MIGGHTLKDHDMAGGAIILAGFSGSNSGPRLTSRINSSILAELAEPYEPSKTAYCSSSQLFQGFTEG